MLRIHTGLWKLSKTNVYDLNIKKKNPFDIGKPCIKISKSELLFEQYRMVLKKDKYDIDVRYDDTIERNGIFLISYN